MFPNLATGKYLAREKSDADCSLSCWTLIALTLSAQRSTSHLTVTVIMKILLPTFVPMLVRLTWIENCCDDNFD